MAKRDKALRESGLAALAQHLRSYFQKTDTAGKALITLSESTEQGFSEAETAIAEAAKTAEASGVKFSDGQTFQQKYDAGALTGPPGKDGAIGPVGPTGAAGPKGDTGDTWVPSVDASTGALSWAKNSGAEPQTVNIKGPKGDTGANGTNGKDGAAGKDGVSPAVKVSKSGTVTTVTITDASGEHTSTINDGAPGKDGAAGATGPTGPQGAQGAKGDPGTTPKVSATLPVSGWVDTTDADFKNAGYAKMYALAASGATAADGADCRFTAASLKAANACGMCATVNVVSGAIRFYAVSAPAQALALEYQLIKG